MSTHNRTPNPDPLLEDLQNVSNSSLQPTASHPAATQHGCNLSCCYVSESLPLIATLLEQPVLKKMHFFWNNFLNCGHLIYSNLL